MLGPRRGRVPAHRNPVREGAISPMPIFGVPALVAGVLFYVVCLATFAFHVPLFGFSVAVILWLIAFAQTRYERDWLDMLMQRWLTWAARKRRRRRRGSPRISVPVLEVS